MPDEFFSRLVWSDDRVVLDDLVFRLEQVKSGADLDGECFRFYKARGLVDQYERFWTNQPDFRPRSILELGMWDGGSVAFWNEMFHPDKHIGVDIEDRPDSAYFERFVRSRGLDESVRTFWGVDQADAGAIRSIISTECPGTLDLVIDDGAHTYRETKASFETILPLVQPGGLYVIEDWAWAHWGEYQSPDHRWARDVALTTLIVELVEAIGSSAPLIANIAVIQGFAVIERGETEVDDPTTFRLADHIVRRPGPRSFLSRARRSFSSRARRRWARLKAKGSTPTPPT